MNVVCMSRYLKMQDVLDRLIQSNMRVFSVLDVVKITRKKPAYVSKMLSHNKKVKRAIKGLYYITGIDGADIYEIASNIVYPSYVSMFAAFQYYSLTDQSVIKYSVITLKRHRAAAIDGNEIEFITLNRNRFFGYKKIGNAFMASVEKAIIDSLYLGSPEKASVKEAYLDALRHKMLKKATLVEYAKMMHSASLLKKVRELVRPKAKGNEVYE